MFDLDAVTVRYGQRTALGPITVTLEAGSSVALMGPNGSGKTTLLRVLAGLTKPSSGTVASTGSAEQAVGYVGQHQHQHGWLPITAGEVVTASRYKQLGLLRPLRGADRTAIADAMDRLRVGDLRQRSFGELSGGQRQRVLMAAALAADAPLLLLDEPITGLDLPSQQLIVDVIDAERAAGRLVVVSTHHLDEARHCDRVLLLRTIVVADGTPDEVLDVERLAATFGPSIVGVGDGVSLVDDHGHGSHDHDHAGAQG